MRFDELSPDVRAGLLDNVASMDAQEDLRMAVLVGAVFGGKDGREYLEHLADAALDGYPDLAERTKEMIQQADAKRGFPDDAPKIEGPPKADLAELKAASVGQWQATK